jgi:hypothetical protein
MSNQVKVEDLEAFARFRAALLKFAQAADQSLSAADSQIARTHAWLENEQARYWEGQIRKRTDLVAQAKDAVRQKKLYLDGAGRQRGAPEEEKALARAVAMLEQAHEKRDAVKKWLPRLEKAADLYRGGVSRLATDITAEVPKAVALLDRLAESLQAYLAVESPSFAGMETAVGGVSMANPAGGEAEGITGAGEREVAQLNEPPTAAEAPGGGPSGAEQGSGTATTGEEVRDGHHG